MALSAEVRELSRSWSLGQFPKFLQYIEIKNIRGWSGENVSFSFPIVAIVGENGLGKSTILQASAALYKAPTGEQGYYASTFFPDTAWENLIGVEIKGLAKEGADQHLIFIRKPTIRWRGMETRRERAVRFLDLRRISPINSKTGYARLAKKNLTEANSEPFSGETLSRLSTIIGRTYSAAKQATTSLDSRRRVPVLNLGPVGYSGFHQGAGETAIAELLSSEIPQYSLVVIDEIETCLHPRAQRRLVKDLARISRLKKVQFIFTTHSPFILEELPVDARVQIINNDGSKKIVPGVSVEFALSRMDDERHTELDVYVEDGEAKILLEEIIAKGDLPILNRLQIIPFGAASVGKALGQMNAQNRFPQPTLVFLDGDQAASDGCILLPGNLAPERIVLSDMDHLGWPGVAPNINRDHDDLVNQGRVALTLPNHHDWLESIANQLIVGKQDLWRASCRSWVANKYHPAADNTIIAAIRAKLL